MPKEIRSPNDEKPGLGIPFGFGNSDFFRHSSFGFRHSQSREAYSYAVEERPGSDGGRVDVCRRAKLANNVALHRRAGRLGAEVGASLQEVTAVGDAGPGDCQAGGNKERCLQPKGRGAVRRVGPDAVESGVSREGSGVDIPRRARQPLDICPQEVKVGWER